MYSTGLRLARVGSGTLRSEPVQYVGQLLTVGQYQGMDKRALQARSGCIFDTHGLAHSQMLL